MNHTDVIHTITVKTGLDTDLCNTVVKAFEAVSGAAILGKLGGKHLNTAEMAEKVAAASAVPADTCAQVLTALDEVMGDGLSAKFGFGKGSK